MLTALGKHTTTVFSGEIPNTMEFLDPERTFDKTVDGLRDFIISLDKEKADKLRYKVEDNVVKIYITPYKSKITEEDLNFSQGDFNVDLVVALGVHERNDLDDAITSHGRILHDATIVTINDTGDGKSKLGAVDWTNTDASCLAEMLVSISEALEGGILDKQMSTAFLTGIVAATDRFKNDKTTPKLMTMAAQLMAAGANQQQIAQSLQLPDLDIKPEGEKKPKDGGDKKKKDGDHAAEDETMSIDRDSKNDKGEEDKKDKPADDDDGSREPEAKPHDEESLAQREVDVHAKHNELDESGRTKKLDDEDPAIKQLEDDLAHDSNSNLIDLEDKLKSFDPNSVSGAEPATPQPPVQPPKQQPLPPQNDGPVGHVRGSDATAIDEDEKPLMGGTFNATSEEAHDRIEADRHKRLNKELLSHGGPVGGADSNATSRGKDLMPGGDSANNNMPSSEELMHDLQEARRAVEEAMSDSAGTADSGPIQALNAAPMEMDDGSGGDLNLSNNNMAQMNNAPMGGQQPQMNPMPQPQQQFMPPGQQPMGGQQMPMPNSMPQQQMPGQQQYPPAQNPMFNLPPQQPQQPFNNGGQMPPQNGQQGPPPMPPNGPPPMPPFN